MHSSEYNWTFWVLTFTYWQKQLAVWGKRSVVDKLAKNFHSLPYHFYLFVGKNTIYTQFAPRLFIHCPKNTNGLSFLFIHCHISFPQNRLCHIFFLFHICPKIIYVIFFFFFFFDKKSFMSFMFEVSHFSLLTLPKSHFSLLSFFFFFIWERNLVILIQ